MFQSFKKSYADIFILFKHFKPYSLFFIDKTFISLKKYFPAEFCSERYKYKG